MKVYSGLLLNRAQAVGVFERAFEATKQPLQGGQTLTITIDYPKRTPAQNARYWSDGVLSQIASQAMGGRFSAETWHEQFKRQFIGVVELPNGEVVGMSSTKLRKAEFSEFCTKVEAYATTDLNVIFTDLKQ